MNQTTDVIVTQGLSKSFGSVQALRGVDLRVPPHSIFGFLGPNGAGKTTLMKVLLGLNRPSGGSGAVFGYDIQAESVRIRERTGYLPQMPRFIDTMTARENLYFTARFFYRGPRRRLEQRCAEMLDLVGLAGRADRPIRGFSGGEKQRLGIALAQVNDPDLLILDEPASALDPIGRQEVLAVMERLRERTTIFYSTHILDDVQRVSDTVGILNHGRLVACGPIQQILNHQGQVVYTLTVRGGYGSLGLRLESLPFVTDAVTGAVTGAAPELREEYTSWQIQVSDPAAAEAGLLRSVLEDPQVVVSEFSRKTYQLEEAFMAIVKGSGDGAGV